MVMVNDVGLFEGSTGEDGETREVTGAMGVCGVSLAPVSPITVGCALFLVGDLVLPLGVSG